MKQFLTHRRCAFERAVRNLSAFVQQTISLARGPVRRGHPRHSKFAPRSYPWRGNFWLTSRAIFPDTGWHACCGDGGRRRLTEITPTATLHWPLSNHESSKSQAVLHQGVNAKAANFHGKSQRCIPSSSTMQSSRPSPTKKKKKQGCGSNLRFHVPINCGRESGHASTPHSHLRRTCAMRNRLARLGGKDGARRAAGNHRVVQIVSRANFLHRAL